ncbi:MAG TPA: hypothetical protein VGI31_08425 [Streptosporangiaceae bacterium]
MAEQEIPPGGELVGDDAPWQPWSPAQAAERLAAVPVPWAVAGGWAADLFRGETTREHEDLEIAIPAAGFPAVRTALGDLEFDVVGDGRRWPADSEAFGVHYQTWGREPGNGIYRIDVFREPHDAGIWICRRDESIRRPYDAVILRSADGVPYLAPEIVLLFKAKHARPKDEADFAGLLPLIGPDRRDWLTAALRQVHPGHHWLASL